MSTQDWPAPYTALDYLTDSIDQVQRLEAARREVHERFLADQKRVEEWNL